MKSKKWKFEYRLSPKPKFSWLGFGYQLVGGVSEYIENPGEAVKWVLCYLEALVSPIFSLQEEKVWWMDNDTS